MRPKGIRTKVLTYVAVGFRVSQKRSLFYFKTERRDYFWRRLAELEEKESPDFISLRFVREDS